MVADEQSGFSGADSNAGDGVNINWSSAAINAFAALWTAAIANGWKISTASLPTFNFTYAAANAPGPYYLPALADPLFDT
jgi:hypothetical protein